MRERINRLARGIIDSEAPQVVITPEQVEEQVPASAKTRGELMVTSSNNLYIKGLVYSSKFPTMPSAVCATGLSLRLTVNTSNMEKRLRDLFIWSPMAAKKRFLILCVFKAEFPAAPWSA